MNSKSLFTLTLLLFHGITGGIAAPPGRPNAPGGGFHTSGGRPASYPYGNAPGRSDFDSYNFNDINSGASHESNDEGYFDDYRDGPLPDNTVRLDRKIFFTPKVMGKPRKGILKKELLHTPKKKNDKRYGGYYVPADPSQYHSMDEHNYIHGAPNELYRSNKVPKYVENIDHEYQIQEHLAPNEMVYRSKHPLDESRKYEDRENGDDYYQARRAYRVKAGDGADGVDSHYLYAIHNSQLVRPTLREYHWLSKKARNTPDMIENASYDDFNGDPDDIPEVPARVTKPNRYYNNEPWQTLNPRLERMNENLKEMEWPPVTRNAKFKDVVTRYTYKGSHFQPV